MISKEHKKHSEIARPSYGNFNRNEWAILGTQCSEANALADRIIQAISSKYKIAYADAQHPVEDDECFFPPALASGAEMEYCNKINYHQFSYNKAVGQYLLRSLFSGADIVLVNGNHFEAQSQVVVIDPAKKSSLQKRISQLTNVRLILLTEDGGEIFEFIKQAIPGWQEIPVYHILETGKIIPFFERMIKMAQPALNGLVLAGGKSERMGYDKSLIEWHGKKQRYFMADMLKDLCNEVFVSCRQGQELEIDNQYKKLTDTFTNLGPYGAILSAFRHQPDAAWLVTACDLPLLDTNTLKHLIANRNTSSIATAFESPFDGLPEPLITIWEPKSYPVLLSFLSQGITCPRKVLRNTDVSILKAPDDEALTNVNTPEETERVKSLIQQKLQHHAH